jgi:hypothetical protein
VSSTDDRLSDALRTAGRQPDVDGVLARVRSKRTRRRATRRAGLAAAALGVAGVVVAGSLAVVGDDPSREVAVGPGPGARPQVRVDGRSVQVGPVRIDPDEGYVRGPLLATGDVLTFAAYERASDGFTFPPSRIVRVRGNGRVVDRVDLQGEILSAAEGEGARWVLTRDKEVLGPLDAEFRVKRVGPSGGVLSNAVPPGERPAGPIVASGGGVWVPVRDAVLRFDPATGALAQRIPLTTSSDRHTVFDAGKFVAVTDGAALARLDPATGTAPPVGELTLPAGAELVDGVTDAEGYQWVLALDETSRPTVLRDGQEVPLPGRFTPEALEAVPDGIWVTGIRDGRFTAVLLSLAGDATVRTAVLTRDRDATVVFRSSDAAVLASGGALFAVDLSP